PCPGHEIHHAACRLQHQKCQPEMPENPEGSPAALAVDVQLWLDLRFEYVQVLVDAPGCYPPELAIDQRQIGKDGQAQCQERDADPKRPSPHHSNAQHQDASPSCCRNFCSLRFISPWSVSWS